MCLKRPTAASRRRRTDNNNNNQKTFQNCESEPENTLAITLCVSAGYAVHNMTIQQQSYTISYAHTCHTPHSLTLTHASSFRSEWVYTHLFVRRAQANIDASEYSAKKYAMPRAVDAHWWIFVKNATQNSRNILPTGVSIHIYIQVKRQPPTNNNNKKRRNKRGGSIQEEYILHLCRTDDSYILLPIFYDLYFWVPTLGWRAKPKSKHTDRGWCRRKTKQKTQMHCMKSAQTEWKWYLDIIVVFAILSCCLFSVTRKYVE